MFIHFDADRESDSPFIERVWRCHSERAGHFLSIASSHCEMVITRLDGQTMLTLRGPQTTPTEVPCPANGEWLAIRFKVGVYLPQFPAERLINSLGVNLPQASSRTFLLDGRKWELPSFDNAESFVARLVNQRLLSRDQEVSGALHCESTSLSTRSLQRRFLQAAGMTRSDVLKIERARFAVTLLREAVPIAEVAWQCGYYDHAHLTRSLRRWIGLPPSKITATDTQLSFLYKTRDLPIR